MDHIADFINQLKTASLTRKESVTVPYSKMILSIAELLKKEGYVGEITKKGKKVIKTLEVGLVYENNQPKVQGVQRISKLSRRMYNKADEIRPLKQGYGMRVYTTPKGILSDRDARKENIGGEILFNIW